LSDKPTKHDTGSNAGVTAEYHEANAPALPSDKNAECKQQGASAGNAKDVCSGQPKRSAEDIALLATHGKRQRGKACQA
jgi:hypothetical protein